MYEQPFNPYASNVTIVKDYFKSGKVLFIGILYIISTVLSILSVITTPSSANYYEIMQLLEEMGIDASDASTYITSSSVSSVVAVLTSSVITVLTAVAFIILFAKSRSNNPNSNPKAGAGILHVLAVISFVCSIVITVFAVIFYLLVVVLGLALSDNYYGDSATAEATVVMVLVGILLAIVLFLLIFANAKRKNYYRSVKNSLSTVELQNTGATAWGVLCIIVSVFLGIAVLTTLISTLTSYITLSSILSLVTLMVTFVIEILDASIALGYSRHIKRHKFGYSSMPYNSGYVPGPTVPTYRNDQPTYYSGAQIPSDRPTVPYNDSFSDYNAPVRPAVCPNCGAPVDENSAFCGNCGTKL